MGIGRNTILISGILVGFLVGTLTVSSIAEAVPEGQPFQQLQEQVDDVFEIIAPIIEVFETAQVDSFFDVCYRIELGEKNAEDIAEIQNQVCPDGEVVVGIDANGKIICRLFEVGPPPTPECDVFDTRILTTTFVDANISTGEVTYTLTNNFDCELTFAQGFKSIITSSGASNSFELVELTLGPLEELEVVSVVPIPDPKRDVRWTIFNQVSLADTTPVGNCGSSTCPISGNFFFR